MSSADDFGAAIDRAVAQRVIPRLVELHKAVVVKAYQMISRDSRDVSFEYGSPVWTGRYRGSHRVRIGTPDSSKLPPHPETGKLKHPTEPDRPFPPQGAAYASQAVSALQPFSIVWISNSLPYARRIEAGGFSMKAPDGVYKVTAEAVKMQYANSDLGVYLS